MIYLRRALKYFIQITLLFGVAIAFLMATGMAESDINVAFRHGWQSIWLILAVFAAVSLLYPRFGYDTGKGRSAQKETLQIIGKR